MGFESLVTIDKTIAIDSIHKNIYISSTKNTPMPKVAMVDLEKSMGLFKKIEPLTRGKNESGYKIEYKDTTLSTYEKIEVYFSNETFIINEITIYYRREIDFSESFPRKNGEKPKLNIKFKNINTKPQYSESEFSASNFVSEKQGQKVPARKYLGFKIYDQK